MTDKELDDVYKRIEKLEDQVTKQKKMISNLSKKLTDEHETSDALVKSSFSYIVEEWNAEMPKLGIPKITTISGKRAKLVSARLKEYGHDCFHTCIEEIKQSSFLQGKSKRPWTGFTFDWMILPSNFPKVLEGNYNDKRKKEETHTQIPESWIS